MKQFLDQLMSPIWWASVVVVGIIVNLVSAYLKNPTDRLLSSISSWWRQRSTKRTNARNALIERLRGNVSLQVYHSYRSLRIQFISFIMLLFLLVIMAYINPPSLLLWPFRPPSQTSTTADTPAIQLYFHVATSFMISVMSLMTFRLFNRGVEIGLALKEACGDSNDAT